MKRGGLDEIVCASGRRRHGIEMDFKRHVTLRPLFLADSG